MKGLRTRFALACLFLVLTGPAHAQPTNLEAYQELAVRCLAEVPDTAQAFLLDAPEQMPYLRAALSGRWRQEGRALFLADTSFQVPGVALPRLQFEIEEARVAYARAPRKQFTRTVTLALSYTMTAPDGRLLRENRCRDVFTDTIRRTDRLTLETEAFPETQGAPPQGSWKRRYLEPAVIAAATAVTIYLFFNLRSERSDDSL
ncbi:MAG: hypothetical protein ACE5G0_00350 [Rhodothermales bacterium]